MQRLKNGLSTYFKMNIIRNWYLSLFQYLSSFYLWSKDVAKKSLFTLNLISAFSCFIVFTLLVLDVGFHLNYENKIIFESLYKYLLIYFIFDVSLRLFIEKKRILYVFSQPTELCLGVLAFFYLTEVSFGNLDFLTQLGLFLVIIGRFGHFKTLGVFLKLKPAQVFPFGFLFVIFLGSLLLSFPISIVSENGLPYVDALFTVFSAVCVTGLTVVDVSETFTLFGQLLILTLIQIGGLGIMTFSMLLTRLLHRRISTQDSMDFQESYSTFNLKETFKTILFIFKLTFIVEIIGTLCLTVLWYKDFASLGEAFYYSLFHSISAFCNAGFSLFPNSLVSYGTNVPIILVISLLIILGGLGFPALFNMIQVYKTKKSFHWLRLQTKLVIWMTAILILVGTTIILITEYNHALLNFSVVEKVTISFFQSVSARTAGFNTIEIGQFYSGTILILIALMIIGASPGSTGGGIKTTSAYLILLSFFNTLKSSRKLVVSGRTINGESILRAFALFFLALMIIFGFLFALSFFENQPFLNLFFETVSAFGTVGFSLGVTSLLSTVGKILVMMLMFIGRIGPLSLAFALSRSKPEVKYSYPEENIAIV
jgi:trk system potassium uptake protein